VSNQWNDIDTYTFTQQANLKDPVRKIGRQRATTNFFAKDLDTGIKSDLHVELAGIPLQENGRKRTRRANNGQVHGKTRNGKLFIRACGNVGN
jgi:hypothetical protein